MDIDQAFIAAILTVVGYSINDTVVIYDRIREYLPLYRKRPTKEVYNMALNSTLARTLNTGMATIFVLIIVFIFGGEVIQRIYLCPPVRYSLRNLLISVHFHTCTV